MAALTVEQQYALNLITLNPGKGGVVFVHGGPGVGKSNVVKALVQQCQQTGTLRVAAMTGKAAYPIGGATAHSAFLLGRAKKGRPTPAFSEKETRRLVDGLHGVEYVLIDEASMCGTVYLEELERNLRAGRKSDDPKRKLWFGGFRVVFVGDFAQCPAITPGRR